MKFILTEELPEIEYFKEEMPKGMIVLHHTVSSTAKSTSDWFKADKGKSHIAVAFVVDKNGDIYKLFEPAYWAWHIGTGSTKRQNQVSIGVELVNEGPLAQSKEDDKKSNKMVD